MDVTLDQLKTEVVSLNSQIINHFRNFESPSHKLMNDGIVNLSEYYHSPIRILWVLKEPYDKNENGQSGGWSMTEALDKVALGRGKDSKTWDRISYSTFGILNNFQGFEKIVKSNDKEQVKEVLRKIAFINVKKIPGETTTSSSTLIKAYNQNKEILIKQIATFRPHIVIGGKTLHLFKKDLNIQKENELDAGHFSLNNQLFLNTFHPAQRKISNSEYINKIISRAEQYKNIYLN